jgi:hypothetical protein
MSDAKTAKPPFFILGCVRSGTTMLRNALRLHPNLASPEETHFYRWGEPFGGVALNRMLANNPVLKGHRKIDGISDEDFQVMLEASVSRADLCQRYMSRFIELRKPEARRWFDKTPQNAYGAAMIAMEFPKARFIHIVRDPVNVVASLRIGKVMRIEEPLAACNYWNEAVANLAVLQRAFPGRVLELSYERFTEDPQAGLSQVLEFIGEPPAQGCFDSVRTETVRHEDSGVLSDEVMALVRRLCLQGRLRHGYASPEERAEAKALRAARQAARPDQKTKAAGQTSLAEKTKAGGKGKGKGLRKAKAPEA